MSLQEVPTHQYAKQDRLSTRPRDDVSCDDGRDAGVPRSRH